jgi:hypothetical protein
VRSDILDVGVQSRPDRGSLSGHCVFSLVLVIHLFLNHYFALGLHHLLPPSLPNCKLLQQGVLLPAPEVFCFAYDCRLLNVKIYSR